MRRQVARVAVWARCLMIVLPVISGCAPAPGSTCLLPTQRKWLSITLYFGRAISGRAPLAQAEWDAFVAAQLAPRFPDGFTVIDGEGFWRDPRTGETAGEATKIVQVVAEPGARLAGRVAEAMAAYRSQFNQVAVGVVSEGVCAAF